MENGKSQCCSVVRNSPPLPAEDTSLESPGLGKKIHQVNKLLRQRKQKENTAKCSDFKGLYFQVSISLHGNSSNSDKKNLIRVKVAGKCHS